MKRTIIWSITLCLLAGSCEKEDLGNPFCNPGKYFPLEIGNYWIFRNYVLYDDGNIDDMDTDSMYISSDTLMLGYRYFHLQGNFHRKPVNYYLTYAADLVISSANYVFYKCPELIDSKKLYPVMGFDFPAILKTTRMDTVIKVPAGDFDPVMLFEAHSMLDDSILIVTYKTYYARNIGIVKFSARPQPVSSYESFTELVRYHVGN